MVGPHHQPEAVVVQAVRVVRLVCEQREADHRYAVVDRLVVAAVAAVRDEQFGARVGEQVRLRDPGEGADVGRQVAVDLRVGRRHLPDDRLAQPGERRDHLLHHARRHEPVERTERHEHDAVLRGRVLALEVVGQRRCWRQAHCAEPDDIGQRRARPTGHVVVGHDVEDRATHQLVPRPDVGRELAQQAVVHVRQVVADVVDDAEQRVDKPLVEGHAVRVARVEGGAEGGQRRLARPPAQRVREVDVWDAEVVRQQEVTGAEDDRVDDRQVELQRAHSRHERLIVQHAGALDERVVLAVRTDEREEGVPGEGVRDEQLGHLRGGPAQGLPVGDVVGEGA